MIYRGTNVQWLLNINFLENPWTSPHPNVNKLRGFVSKHVEHLAGFIICTLRCHPPLSTIRLALQLVVLDIWRDRMFLSYGVDFSILPCCVESSCGSSHTNKLAVVYWGTSGRL